MKKILMDRNFALLFAAILLSAISINFCSKIYQCACFFTIMVCSAHFISQRFSFKVSATSLAVALSIAFALLINVDYKIYGKIYQGIIMTSFLSVFVSFYVASKLFKNNREVALPVLVLVAGLIDGVIMSAYFYNSTSIAFVAMVFAKEIGFKITYSLAIMFIHNLLTGKKLLPTVS